MDNKPFTVTVSQLNRKIAFMLGAEKTFADLYIKGEISNFSLNAKTGHIFFTLKDESSAVKAVMFRSMTGGLKFMPENGMAVTVRGSVKCFERDGVYQIYVSEIIRAGEGALSAAFEELKDRLAKEGLFSRKRSIVYPPKKICLITSPSGAALQDMLNILGRRWPIASAVIIPAAVQGENAPASIVSAFKKAASTGSDVIIFGRGGGSSEDLSAFNDEEVVRAVYLSPIPTISAVGHETDFTLSDFAADKRAPTPSAAAELCVPDIRDYAASLETTRERIRSKLAAVTERKATLLKLVTYDIQSKSPSQRVNEHSSRLETMSAALKVKMDHILTEKRRGLERSAAVIEALSPMAVLMRGYSITYKDEKALLSSEEVSKGDRLRIRLAKGYIDAVAEDIG